MTAKQVGRVRQRSAIENPGPTTGAGDVLHSEDPCSVAQEMMIEFGPEAAGIALDRADQALDAGDGEGFQVWLDVAAAIQGFATRSDG